MLTELHVLDLIVVRFSIRLVLIFLTVNAREVSFNIRYSRTLPLLAYSPESKMRSINRNWF